MVTVARLLNLTLIVPELDKTSFWADPRCVYHSEKVTLLFPSFIAALKVFDSLSVFAVILRTFLM